MRQICFVLIVWKSEQNILNDSSKILKPFLILRYMHMEGFSSLFMCQLVHEINDATINDALINCAEDAPTLGGGGGGAC